MVLKAKFRKLLFDRDDYCWHCGDTETLVPHHRKNRGMGGSSSDEANRLDNLMLVCWGWNDLMERHAQSAQEARSWGHKLQMWQRPQTPVYDRVAGLWWVLEPDGTRGKFVVDESKAFRLQLPDLFE